MKRLKKISWNEKEVHLEWTTSEWDESRDIDLTCKDEPHLDFRSALQALKADVLTICGLDKGYGEEMRVQSVTLSFNEKSSARGVVVTAMKTLDIANAPLALHTPHLIADEQTDMMNERAGRMPDGMLARIEALEKEAWAYASSEKRAPKSVAQATAPEEEKEEETEEAGV